MTKQNDPAFVPHSKLYDTILDRAQIDRNFRSGMFLITPDLSRTFLNKVRPNRRQKSENSAKIDRAMTGGHWQKNGEPIVFDSEDYLVEGEHRCRVSVAKNVPFWSMVVWGVDPTLEVRATINEGAPRTPGDYLRINYETKNANACAAVAGMIWRFTRGIFNTARGHLANYEIGEVYLANRTDIDAAVKDAYEVYNMVSPSLPAIAYSIMEMRRQDRQWADEFIGKLLGRVACLPGEPADTLRKKLYKLKNPPGNQKPKVEANNVVFYFLRAWNADRRNQPLHRLQLPDQLEIPRAL